MSRRMVHSCSLMSQSTGLTCEGPLQSPILWKRTAGSAQSPAAPVANCWRCPLSALQQKLLPAPTPQGAFTEHGISVQQLQPIMVTSIYKGVRTCYDALQQRERSA